MNQFNRFDEIVLNLLNQLVGLSPTLDAILRIMAEWLVYLVPILLLGAWFWVRYFGRIQEYINTRISLVEATLAGLLGWLGISTLIKAFYFRPRPTQSDNDVQELFFHRPDASFPSDHAILLFALATYFYLLGWKRVSYYTGIIAIVVSMARIITAIHWTTDILAGAAIGVSMAYLIWSLRAPLKKIIRPLIRLVSRIGL